MSCKPFTRRKKCRLKKGGNPGKTLRELISHFRLNHLRILRTELRLIRKATLQKVIEASAHAEDLDGTRHSHHRRRTKRTLEKAFKRLAPLKRDLHKCGSFEEVIQLISEATKKIKWLGPLYKYDCSLNIATKLNRQPKAVYLHNGTREGAKALGLDWRQDQIPVHNKLKSLKPHEVEDFLCIYKAWLRPPMLKD